MTRIFVALYLDEDVDVLVSELLRARGYSVATTRDAGQLGNTDAEQLAYATRNERAILTHNRLHFEALGREYLATGRTHFGILLANRHSPHEIARRLLLLLNQVTADELKDQIRYI
jgi:predicted nuclease of predicted toxin-antitoxin system